MKFSQMTILLKLMLLVFILSSCSTAIVRVLPGQNGVHKILARDIEQDTAEKAAYKAAKDYCEDKEPEQEAVFLKEKSIYTGKMDENARKGVRSVSKAIAFVPGGSILSSIGTKSTDDRDYKAGLLFKCQKVN